MSFVNEVLNNIFILLKLAVTTKVLWLVIPLLGTTIVMIFYFQKYKDERPGWNTLLGNSLVLVFISIELLKSIYYMDSGLALNFIEHSSRTIVSGVFLILAVVIMFLNFKHVFPEKVAEFLCSPLTINTLGLTLILYVYSSLENSLGLLISLILIYLFLLLVFNLIKYPTHKLFTHLKKMKEKERKEEILDEKKDINERKKELKKQEKQVREEKKKLKKQEKQEKQKTKKELDKEKKEVIGLKKLLNKPSKKKSKKSKGKKSKK